MGLGYQALLQDLGIHADLRVWTDSSAAIGIAGRQGLGKLRHLDAHTLWLQQAVRSKRLELKKVLGPANPADVLTKHSLTREKLLELVDLFDCRFVGGRAESAPALRREAGGKKTMASYDDTGEQVNSVEAEQPSGEQAPFFPHLLLSRPELDEAYPSLKAPDDFDAANGETTEPTLQAGLRVAASIAKAMKVHGRTRQDKTQDTQAPC